MTAAVSGVAAQPSPMKGGVYIHPCTLRRRSTAADVFVSLARNGSLADFLHHTRDIPTSVMEELLRIAPGQPSSSSSLLSSSRCPSDGTTTRTMREMEEMAHSAFYTALRSATRVPQLVSFDFCITNATVPDDVMDGSAEAHPNANQPRRGDDARVKEADPPFLPCERVVSGGGEPDDFPIRQRSSGHAATAPSSSSSPSTTVSDVPQMLATNVRHRLFAAYLEHHLYAARITAPLALHKATFVETAQPPVWESVHGAFLGLREGSSLNASPCISGLERALLVMAVGEAATFHLHHTETFQMTQDFASSMGDKVGRLTEVAMTAMQHPRLRHRSVVVLRLRLLHRHAAVVPLPASPSFLLGPISATSASSSATTSSSTPKHPGEDGEAANAPTPSESASFAAPVELTEAEQRLLARAIFGEETKEPFTQQEPSATTEEPPQPPQPKNTRAMSYHLRHMISAAFMQSSTTPITSTGIVLFSAAFFMAGQYLLPPGAATTTPPTTHNNTTDEVVEPEPTLESVLAKTMLRHPHDPATVDCLFRTRDRLILHTREKAGIFGVSMRGLRLGSIAIPCTMDAMLRATSPIVGQLRSYRANCPSRGRDGEIIAMCLALHQGRQQALVQQSLGFDRWIALLHNRAADGDELYEAAMVAPAERATLNNYGNSGAAAPDQSAAHNIFAEERAHTRLSNLTMFDAVRRMNECFSLSVKFPTQSASSSHPHPATTTTTTTEGAPNAGVAPTCPMSASHFYAIHPAESLLHVHHLLDEMGAMMQLYDCQRPRTNATSVADAIRRGAALSLPYRMQLDSLDARYAAGKVHLPHILYGLPGRLSSNDGPTPSPSGSGPTRGGALDLGQAAAAALFVPPAPSTPAARERVLMHRLLLQVVQKAYLGISYMMLGDVTEVENHIRAIFLEKMTTQPNTPPPTTATACGRLEALGELLHLLALALAELPGMAVMAYEACTASLTLHLEHSPLWMLRAHILARQKRFTQALADVEVAEYLLTVSTTGTTVPGSLHMDPTSPDDATAMMPGVPQKPNSLSALRLQTTRALKAAIQELVECTPGIVDV